MKYSNSILSKYFTFFVFVVVSASLLNDIENGEAYGVFYVMKRSIQQNEKHRMYISSHDLNYVRNNLCDFVKNDVEFCRNSTDVFCFIHERIVLTHIMFLFRETFHTEIATRNVNLKF